MPKTLIGVNPIKDWVFVDIYDNGQKLTKGKIILLSDESFDANSIKRGTDRHPGIRGRWAMVIGTNQRAEDRGIKVGQKVFLDELKWTRGFATERGTHKKAWAIKIDDILLVDEDGFDTEMQETFKEKYGDF